MNRRRFLKAAGACLALPLLDIDADEKAKKKIRLACFYFPNGTTRSSWKPRKVASNGRLIELASGMKSLERFKKDIVIPERIWTPRGNGHGAGTATWLTGHSFDGNKIDAGGTSLDQLIARKLSNETPIASLELSMKGEGISPKTLPETIFLGSMGLCHVAASLNLALFSTVCLGLRHRT